MLDRAQQATRDEIRHAKMAFSIAQDLLQKDVQPSQLDYTPSLCTDIHEFARTTLEEGAIGETLAVLLASEQLRVATDSSIQSFFKQVVEDEAQHAELADGKHYGGVSNKIKVFVRFGRSHAKRTTDFHFLLP